MPLSSSNPSPLKPDTPRHSWFAIVVVLGVTALALALSVSAGAWAQVDKTPPTPTDEPWVEIKKGLMFRDLELGEGNEAKRGKRVSMRYAGWLEDGTQFDSNRNRALLVFQVGTGEVVKGWDLGVVGMKVGGTRQLLIPAKLAYGKRGIPGRIPKDATLLFEINLRGVF